MRVEGTLVRMEHSSSGAGSGQGQVRACAWLLVVRLQDTTVTVAGWSKRRELPDGGDVQRRFSRQAQLRGRVDTGSPE